MTKKVVRKKRVNKTKRRSRTRSRRTRVKRGGMMRATKFAKVSHLSPELRTLLYHKIIPLFKQYKYYVGSSELDPSRKCMVIHGEKHFNSPVPPKEMFDIFKQSLNDAIKEGQDPVKTGEKLIALQDKVEKAIDKEERKQQDKENSKKSKQGTASQFPFPHVSPFSLRQQYGTPSRTNLADALKEIMAGPTGTPNTDKRPDYSTEQDTSKKPRSKRDIIRDDDDDDDDDYEIGFGVKRNLFGSETPTSSPARSPSHNRQDLEENELVRRLDL